jgi:enoyl-CoA hydratase/carnithine racemase
LHDLEIPTIAALHGHVIGSGLEMALLCDVRVAAEGTQFRFPELSLGFIPAATGTQTLPRLTRLGFSGCSVDWSTAWCLRIVCCRRRKHWRSR